VALGCARMMGIKFPENFDFPYLASSPREFWRRWHISLSSWIRDYLYLPLAREPV
jgi:D-alanyl-lipoteichoic acid acyltransferase DltB (MBOAT superfamily)